MQKTSAQISRKSDQAKSEVDTEVAIVGSGFGGIGLAIKLRLAGMNNFRIFEQADSVGGAWRENTYPGAACDVPSHLYSFSFEPNPKWSKAFAPQKEILNYLEYCAEKHKLKDNISFNTRIERAEFIEEIGIWHIHTNQGKLIRARAIVGATGALSVPSKPTIPGLSKFKGKVFHTAEWDHSVDLTDKQVAVIGTGASAIQVIPAVVSQVKKLSVLQRTPAWVLPKFDHSISKLKRWSYAHLPFTQTLARQAVYLFGEAVTPIFIGDSLLSRLAENIARRYIHKQVQNPDLRAKLTPDYRIGCKRVLLSDDYYQAMTHKNTEVVTESIKEVSARHITTADGQKHDIDIIILATGFKVPVASAPFDIRGLNGRSLDKEWHAGSEAYKGITISGYPNLALIMGPNTGPGNTSVIFYIESQLNYIMNYLKTLQVDAIVSLDVKPGIQKQFNLMIDQRMKKTVWSSGCQSWYLTADGRNTSLWPGFSAEYRLQTILFKREEYEVAYLPSGQPQQPELLEPREIDELQPA